MWGLGRCGVWKVLERSVKGFGGGVGLARLGVWGAVGGLPLFFGFGGSERQNSQRKCRVSDK